MKRVKQVERSKKIIAEAFFRLLKDYDYEQISISHIVSEAGVARNTFYRNFESIQGIMEYTLESAFEQAMASLLAKDKPTLRDLVAWRVHFARQHPYHVHIEGQPFLKMMWQKFDSQNSVKLLALISPDKPQSSPFQSVYHQAGQQAVICQWVWSGCQQPEAEVVEFLLEQVTK